MSSGREIEVLEALRQLLEAEDRVIAARAYAGEVLNQPHNPITYAQLAEITGISRSKIYWLKKLGKQKENNVY